MRHVEQQHIVGPVRPQVFEDRVDPADVVRRPLLDLLQEVRERLDRATHVGGREGLAGSRPERPEDVAAELAVPVALQLPLDPAGAASDQLASRVGAGALELHLVTQRTTESAGGDA